MGQLDEMRTFQTELKRSKLKRRQQGERVKGVQAHRSGGGEGALPEVPPSILAPLQLTLGERPTVWLQWGQKNRARRPGCWNKWGPGRRG